jgi:uncharacterized protein YeaO (DUF488 family)
MVPVVFVSLLPRLPEIPINYTVPRPKGKPLPKNPLAAGSGNPHHGFVATVRIKRVYEPRDRSDGTRILIMRFWPRGIRKDHVDEWNRDVAPSQDLLFAFKRRGLSWREYARRYRAELRPEAVGALRARKGRITLLCGCADESHCHRSLLQRAIRAS